MTGAKLWDADWRAAVDLIVPREDYPAVGTFVAAGEVIPAELRDRAAAAFASRRRSR